MTTAETERLLSDLDAYVARQRSLGQRVYAEQYRNWIMGNAELPDVSASNLPLGEPQRIRFQMTVIASRHNGAIV